MRKSVGILLVFLLFQIISSSLALLIAGVSMKDVQEMSPEMQQTFNVTLCYAMLVGNVIMMGVLWVLKYVRKNPFRSFSIDETEENCKTSEASDNTIFSHQNTSEQVSETVSTTQDVTEQIADTAVVKSCKSVQLGLMSYIWAVAAFLLFAFSLSFVLTPMNLNDGGSTSLFESVKTNPLCLLLLCFVGPLGEELVFREGIMRQLLVSRHSPIVAAVGSSLMFALFHGNLAQGVPAFLSGIMLGYLFLQSGDIRLSLAAHIFNNMLGVTLMFFPEHESVVTEMSSTANLMIAFVLVTLSMGCCKMMTRKIEHDCEQ